MKIPEFLPLIVYPSTLTTIINVYECMWSMLPHFNFSSEYFFPMIWTDSNEGKATMIIYISFVVCNKFPQLQMPKTSGTEQTTTGI